MDLLSGLLIVFLYVLLPLAIVVMGMVLAIYILVCPAKVLMPLWVRILAGMFIGFLLVLSLQAMLTYAVMLS
jgi:hypothetical protein